MNGKQDCSGLRSKVLNRKLVNLPKKVEKVIHHAKILRVILVINHNEASFFMQTQSFSAEEKKTNLKFSFLLNFHHEFPISLTPSLHSSQDSIKKTLKNIKASPPGASEVRSVAKINFSSIFSLFLFFLPFFCLAFLSLPTLPPRPDTFHYFCYRSFWVIFHP